MFSQIPIIISLTHKKIIKKVPDLIVFQKNCGGFELWLSSLQAQDNSAFKIIILMLQCVELWGEIHGKDAKGKETQFLLVYQNLKAKEIEFPPSFFLKSCNFAEKNVTKRDLSRVRRLCKEFTKAIYAENKDRALGLKKIANSYEKVLEKELNGEGRISKKAKDVMIFVLKQLKEAKVLFEKWKSGGFSLMSVKNDVKLGVLIEDPCPKNMPLNDCLSDCDEDLNFEDIFDSGKYCNEHGFCPSHCKESAELTMVKEQFLDCKELLNTYKTDLKNLQEKYCRLIDEKQANENKVKELIQNNQDLERCLLQNKSMFHKVVSENNGLVKENDALKYQNEVYKKNIDQLNKAYQDVEEENEKIMKNLECLENGNVLLLYSNQTLKFELEKANTKELALVDIINSLRDKKTISNKNSIPKFAYLTPKELITQTYTTLSDSENERPSINEEELKQIPNSSSKRNKRSRSKTEKAYKNLPTDDGN
ncbi:hypothetical protein SteCoe_12066 [Stentor coeruleus]|uniref:Uncharacterized protein n=1 Tax=Stentor coeruleus TaxID=5963 RepID=A0A1R2CBM8_9CILI|nr:hypothetical protein SteCoe_12066 [Stentor coeruleus]